MFKSDRENAPPPGSHVFHPTCIIFEFVQDIIGMNRLTKSHSDRTVNVASRVITRFYYSHIRKNAPPLGSHTNHLNKFHEDWTINVASREKCPTPGGHVFRETQTIFELIQDILGTNLLTKFHEDRKINVASIVLTMKNAPPPSGHFHEDQTINVASRVLTRFYYSHIRKNAPPLGSHVFQANASRELTRQMLTAHDARSQKLTMSTLCSAAATAEIGTATAGYYHHGPKSRTATNTSTLP
ncbi:hypothetical protein DPMN_052601 [Dreissena polymorpha]|uniref:Uncharacterized protein n=1 Tax=Dreissena polymorpha TaxID=45954 RepID=A0A9D4HN57_DREPO|nr:hypothetical protein DPMN_052601 [Dreissena polymorpha]